jgi:hypothetical protein
VSAARAQAAEIRRVSSKSSKSGNVTALARQCDKLFVRLVSRP